MGKVKKDFKFWLNIFTLVALAVLVVITRKQVGDALSKLGDLNGAALLLMIPLQLLNYYAVARLYQDYFKAQGETLSTKTMYSVALELNFVNHVFPSGGVSGFSYLNLRLKQSGISAAKSALAQIVRFLLTFTSFLMLLFFGMFVLAFRSNTNPLTMLIGSSLAFLTLIGILVSGFIISDEARIQSFVGFLPKFLNRAIGKFRRHKKDTINMRRLEHTLKDLHKDYVVLSSNWRQLVKPFWWALLVNVTDITTIYVVYVAFGSFINPGALILSYGVANFAGLVAVLPGGVGVYEGLMTATLTSAGVEKALALSATVVYRVLNMLIFLPIGYVLYHRVLKRNGGPIGSETHGHVVPPIID
jgi:putative heme transporter